MDEPETTEYPRAERANRPRPTTYPKDGKVAVFIVIASVIGLLQTGFRALGFSVGVGTLRQAVAIVFAGLMLTRLAGGVGLMLSRLWGFLAVLVSSIAILGLTGLGTLRNGTPMSFLWLLFSVYLVIYSLVRLIGLDGPRPR